MACMIFPALSSVALLGVGWQVGFSSFMFPVMTGKVGLCPIGIFRIFNSFVYFLLNVHVFKNVACIFVGPSLKVTVLYIGFLLPQVVGVVEEDLVQFLGVHILGGT